MSFDMYPPPGQPSTPPTWEDIERLSLHYPALHAAVTLVERGDLTREQALILAVFALADAFQQLYRAEVERLHVTPYQPRTFPVAASSGTQDAANAPESKRANPKNATTSGRRVTDERFRVAWF